MSRSRRWAPRRYPVARWTRAVRQLRVPTGGRVLDLGCAFGFGTRLLARHWQAYGHDLSVPYIERARKAVPGAIFTQGPADQVPYPDAFFDAILLLDVLEHVPHEKVVVAEAARVLRPGGQLLLSVPNRGSLSSLDSLNLYRRLLGDRFPPPTDDPSWRSSPVHRHYALADLVALLGDCFDVRSARYTGIGIAEPFNLMLLLLFRTSPRLHAVYERLQYLYFGVYLAEDMIPTGARGYHLMIDAEGR
jgi:SAM-dependent methyltransferase